MLRVTKKVSPSKGPPSQPGQAKLESPYGCEAMGIWACDY